ncbi:TPA: hypothetical protein HMG33_26585 [Escherichia coli]|nr:hypothetical protein [Escherichia coli]
MLLVASLLSAIRRSNSDLTFSVISCKNLLRKLSLLFIYMASFVVICCVSRDMFMRATMSVGLYA